MPLKRKKQLVVLVAVVFALAGLVGYRIYANISANQEQAAQAAQGKKIAVQVAQVGRHDITPAIEFSASLEPVWSADISAKVDGRISDLTIAEGDSVQAGMVIATLDTNDLQAQVVQAQGNLAAAQSTLEQAELDYRRYTALESQGAVAVQVLDNARTKRDLAAGQVQSAQGALTLMQEKLNNANIIVPRDGVVTKRYMQAGTYTRSGSPIITVADVTTLLAKATIGEAQIADVSVGTPVKIMVDALAGQEFAGTITRISPMASLPARTFNAEIEIPNSDGKLKAGMFAKASIPVKVHDHVLAIPGTALVMKEDQRTVFVVGPDNRVQQKTVKIGYIGDGWAEVLEGLNEGDTIVTAGQNKVKDGAEIDPAEGGVE